MKKVAVYCKVSTYDQEKGLQSQEKALQDYCRWMRNLFGLRNVCRYLHEFRQRVVKKHFVGLTKVTWRFAAFLGNNPVL